MKRMGAILALTLVLGIGAQGIGLQLLCAQQAPDPRIADIVKAGKLRVGYGLGSMGATKDPANGEVRGLAVDLGRALAARMGTELQVVEYLRPGLVIEGARTNAWDMAFLVFDPAYTGEADFSPPLYQSDFTYLVRAGSSIRKVADADQPGVRIAVPRGDASGVHLSRVLKRAELVYTDSIPAAINLLRSEQADAYAGPRTVALREAARLPGSQVLEDGFATTSASVIVPKGKPGRLAYVSEFVEEAKASDLIKQAIERHGLKGVWVAPAGTKGPQ